MVLQQDLLARSMVLRLVTVPLSPLQVEALTSWAYDVLNGVVDGLEGGFETAQLLYHVNAQEHHAAGAEFLKWCMVRSKFNYAALERRRYEQQLYLQGVKHVRATDSPSQVAY